MNLKSAPKAQCSNPISITESALAGDEYEVDCDYALSQPRSLADPCESRVSILPSLNMDCDICLRVPEEALNFLCASCARTSAYLPRLEYAQILLEKVNLSSKVEQSISYDQTPSGSNKPDQTADDRKVWHNELKHVQINEIKQTIQHSKVTRDQIHVECKGLRDQIMELKAKIAEKRRNLATIKSKVPQNRDSNLSSLSAANSTTTSSFARLQQRSSSNRATLCREAAFLMRLRQRRRQKDAIGKEQYSIAGLTLPDLRDISNVRCVDLTAVLGSVVHLVLLVAFYLGVRLPAEIHMPAPNHALPTISAPSASYTGRRIETSSPNASSMSNSPSASKHEIGASLRPRSLFIGSDDREERIFNFQQRETHAFNLFVEGITLLAWDIAWLCRTQGFGLGTNSWEEICNIGKNLHQLLIAYPQAPSLTRIQSDKMLQRRPSQSRKASTALEEARRETVGKLAQYSDVSAAAAVGNRTSQAEVMRLWEYSNWQAVALPLRRTLLTEIASADWELLEDQEFDDGGEQFDEAVFVKSRALDGQQYDDARSIMTTRTRFEDEASSRAPGTSGWTKLKSREK